MTEDYIKELNYFATSLMSAFTIFTTWRTAQFTYKIMKRKQYIKDLERTDIVSVD
jgi:hypothetical protein